MTDIDDFDLRILRELQQDGSLTNAELGDRVHLSASQCSRRLQRLTAAGVIDRFTAVLSRNGLGLTFAAYVMVTVRSHAQDDLNAFRDRILALDEVLECAKITGDADYLLKIVACDLHQFNDILTENIMRAPEVSRVRSSIVLHELKSTSQLPLPPETRSRG